MNKYDEGNKRIWEWLGECVHVWNTQETETAKTNNQWYCQKCHRVTANLDFVTNFLPQYHLSLDCWREVWEKIEKEDKVSAYMWRLNDFGCICASCWPPEECFSMFLLATPREHWNTMQKLFDENLLDEIGGADE